MGSGEIGTGIIAFMDTKAITDGVDAVRLHGLMFHLWHILRDSKGTRYR